MSIKREVKDKVKTRWGFVVVFFCLALIFVMASRPMPTYADSGAPGDTVLEVMVSRGLVNINEPFQLTIIAKDGNGNIVENYTGTVCFTSTDSEAVLPGDYTFTTVDQGQKTFDVILKTVGNHNITVTDNNHLIGYWDCNEGSGTVAYDSSGSSNDAVFSGTGGWSTVVPPGSLFANGHSLDLNGADKTFVANPPTMKVDNLTMTAWFYPREACTTGGKCIIYNGDSSYTGYGLLIEEGKLVFMCGGKSLISINSAQLTQNQWHHVALVRSNGTWSVYHNGERQGLDSSLAPNPLDKEGYPPKFFSMAMNALIDDVRFYDRPLSEEEVGLLASGNHLLKTATTGDIRVKQRTGTGAEVDPYLILTAGDLDDVRYNMSAYYKQMEDIELAGQGDWEPIGDESNPFQGHYDGNGQTIYGLQINDDSLVDVGLFGYVGSTGELKNIRLVGIDINSTKPGVHAGGLVGTNRGTIDNCQSAGKVEANVDNQEVAYAGLLVGRNGPEGTITASSSNSGSVETNRAAGAAGGLAGISQGTIERSSNAAQVLDGKYSGGLVGCASGGGTIDGGMTIDDCDNAGNISGLYGGGLIGYIESGPGKITAGRNMGVINGTTAAGGVCGYDATGKIIIENSSNTGNIGSTTYAGGLLGYIGESEELNISNCFNQGVVSCPGTGGGGGYAGGLVGYAGAVSINKGFNTGPVSGRLAGGLLACTDNNNDKRTTISQSYNTGGVTGSFGFGGLVAFDLGPLDIINCYNRGATTQAYAGGAEFYEGGLVARLWNASSITNSYSAAKLERPFYTSFGGLVGDINPQATTTGCYFNNDLAGISRHNGAGTLSNTAAMQAKATYTSWDFEDVWKIMDGVTYPIFQWQPWSDGEKMLADQRALTWQMIKGENLTENNVTTNLLLPGTGAEGSDITWSVEPTEYAQYIDVATGAIMAKPDNDVNITLKAAIKSGAAGPIYKEFLLTLKSKTPKYVLTYDANGGTGDPPPPAQYTAGESLTVAQCGLTNPYKVFKEWNTKADGRGESYQEGAGIIMPPYDLTLYAIWNVHWENGDGSKENPYLIENAEHIRAIPDLMAGEGIAYFKQVGDIDLSAYPNWAPIGSADNPFLDVYNGDGKTIANLTINTNNVADVGLFGCLGDTGRLENIKLQAVNINAQGADVHAGGLVGRNKGTVTGCSSGGNVIANGNNTQAAHAGILAGFNDTEGEISHCSSSGSVKSNRTAGAAGGLAGTGNGTIENSDNTAGVEGRFAGGLVGRVLDSGQLVVKTSHNAGQISGTNAGGLVGYTNTGPLTINEGYNLGPIDGQFAGGLVGYIYGARVEVAASYNNEKVTATSLGGGLIGHCFDDGTLNISKSYNQGEISSASYGGGLAGYMPKGEIENSYNTGSVSGASYAGGLVGMMLNGEISYSHNIGQVIGGSSGKGGLVGTKSDGAVNASYYDAEKSGQNDTGKGEPLTTAAMKEKDSFSGWDFNEVWMMVENQSCPLLQNQLVMVFYELTRWDAIKGGNYAPDNITVDLNLVQQITETFTIAWSVDPEQGNLINTGTGKITRPTKDTEIRLAATLMRDGQVCTGVGPVEHTLVIKSGDALYTVTFDGNGAEEEPLVKQFAPDVEIILPEQGAFTFQYMKIKEWNTRLDGSGDTLTTAYKMPPHDLVFYAIWEPDWQGEGSEENPYQVESAAHLDDLRQKMAGQEGIVHFIQVADIDLGSYENWAPIGDSGNPFNGVFNGNNKTISNLKIRNAATDYAGLFGYVGTTGELKDITLNNIDIDVNRANARVGGLAGASLGTISGCSIAGTIKGSGAGGIAGGLAGVCAGTITNSSNAANVTAVNYVGGLTGHVDTEEISIIGSHNTGMVKGTGTAGSCGGGLVGYTGSASVTMTDCYNGGSVTQVRYCGGLSGYLAGGSINIAGSYNRGAVSSAVTGSYSGGLVGFVNSGTVAITDCGNESEVVGLNVAGGLIGYNVTGPLTISGSYNWGDAFSNIYTGGLLGYIKGTGTAGITNSYNTGEVEAKDTGGGLVGYTVSNNSITISQCYNTAAVIGTNYAGGLTGCLRGGDQITDSYNTGRVTGANTGGLVGKKEGGAVSGSYYDRETSGQGDENKGIPLTTAQMKQQESFAGWDFNNTWRIIEGGTYPKLTWQVLQDEDFIDAFYALTSWKNIKRDNYALNNITGDLNLAQKITETFTIAWGIDPEQGNLINTGTGEITKPGEDTEIRLTATLMRDGQVCADVEPVEHTLVIKSGNALYTVTFDGNGAAEEPLEKQFAPGDDIIVPGPSEFTFQHLVIKEWNTGLDGSGDTLTDACKMPAHDIVFYAIWEPDWQGDGSENNPYQVASVAHLDDLRQKMNEDEGVLYFAQTEDIDLDACESWLPIGDAANPFKGVYRGNDKSITGLTINDSALADIGLFGYVGAAGKLIDITLENVSVTTNKAGVHAGGLAGTNEGIITNCSSTGSVSANGGNTQETHAGMLVGLNKTAGTITGCSSEGTVISNKTNGAAGGLVGTGNGTIENSDNTAGVEGRFAGGLVGRVEDTGQLVVKTSHNAGQISGTNAGGLVGYTNTGLLTINEGYNLGPIDGTFAGGLVGYIYGAQVEVTASYNKEKVTATTLGGGLIGHCFDNGTLIVHESYNQGEISSASYGGGIAGHMPQGQMENCYNAGKVSAPGYAGGLIGLMLNGEISKSYSAGVVTGSGYIGGLIGKKNAGTVTASYYDRYISGQNDTDKGTPQTTAEMKKEATFAGWDFGEIWYIIEDSAYPLLCYQIGDMSQGDQELRAALNALEIGFAAGDSIDSVTANLTLPTSGENDTTFTWASSDPSVITNDGSVTRASGVNRLVRLTATGKKTGVNPQQKTFYLTVIGTSTPPTITGATEMMLNQRYSACSTAPYVITGFPEPVVSMTGGENKITWNEAENRLDIAAGLEPGEYLVVLTVSNNISPDATLTFTLTVKSDFAGGAGTLENPYHIQTAQQLDCIRNYLDKSFVLENDIDLEAACSSGGFAYNSGAGWAPIGGFKGNFDGAGHTISGLSINRSQTDYVGFFAVVGANAVIKNVQLTNVNVQGKLYTGGLAGQLDGLNGRITLQNVSVTGQVQGIGYYTGGLAGSTHAADITQTCGAANVAQTGDYQYAGGLIGYMGNSSILSDSYATGSVTKTDGMQLGGLVGTLYGSITRCYATGLVSGGDPGSRGGLVGWVSGGTVTESYYDKQTSGQSDNGIGTPKTTAEMKQQATFAGWDFDGIWFISENNTYPLLRFQLADMPEGDRMLRAALDALEIGFAAGDSIDRVTTDLTLPHSGENGTTFTWASSDPAVITDDGKVTRGDGVNKLVTLTATGIKEDVNPQRKSFYLTVIGTPVELDITGPTEMLLYQGYSACFTGPYTIAGFPEPEVSMTGGDNHITWNKAAKRLDITAGLELGDYSVTLTASNGVSPDATLTFNLTVISEFAAGDGSPGNPYHIKEARHLDRMRYHLDQSFVLDNDIDLGEVCSSVGFAYNDGAGWLPIGITNYEFTGTFDGAGHTISGLFVYRPSTDFVGLFGVAGQNAVIENVRLTNVDVTGNYNTGGLAGQLNGLSGRITVQNVSVTGQVQGIHCTGGLLGSTHASDITQTFSAANVTQTWSNQYAGGLIGYMGSGSSIADSYATGSVTKTGGTELGGLVGTLNGTITRCYATGLVSGGSYGGGLVGWIGNGTVTNSYYDQQTSGQSDSNKGTPKTTAEMKKEATFAGWDFGEIWYIIEDEIYPVLYFQTEYITADDLLLRAAMDALEISFAEGDNINSVTKDLTLPDQGENDITITWESSNLSVIAIDGTVNPASGVNTLVTLTATGSKEGVNPQRKTFVLTVIGTPVAPTITGPEEMILYHGYGACSTDPYTITGLPEPAVEKTSGDDRITWNDMMKKLDIAAGLGLGDYPVTLTVSNGILPDATLNFTLTVNQEFAGGEGTRENPYRIQTAQHLDLVRNHLEQNFILDNDIDLGEACGSGGFAYNDGAGWLPIGTTNDKFTGTFDGAGHTISGLFINRKEADYAGLFGAVGGDAVIKDIQLTNVDVVGNLWTGGLAGHIQGSGGMITVQRVSVTGQVKGTVNTGGLFGYAFYADISQTFSKANVTQTGMQLMELPPCAGGLIGHLCSSSTLSDSCSTGNVTINREGTYKAVGGLVGLIIGSSIDRCYAAGQVNPVDGLGYIGGVVGGIWDGYWDNSTITNSYYDSVVTGQNDTGKGIPKTTAEMKQPAAFTGWDFANTWQIEADVSYPIPRWQATAIDADITADFNAITWDSIKRGNPAESSIIGNLNLPKVGAQGSNIIWGTTITGWIDLSTGVVTRPTDTPLEVILTATVSKAGGLSKTKDFRLIIAPTGPEEQGCLVTYRGVQKRPNANGAYDIRFLATIDTLEADEVGFVFSKSELAPTRENGTVKATTTVYRSITAAEETITAGELEGTYIIACTVTGIPAEDIAIPFYVRAFSTVGADTKYTAARKITVGELR